jgi:hypothetical protein
MSQMKTTSNGRGPQMEYYLKYQKWNISNNWSDLPQILNLGLYDQSKLWKPCTMNITSNGRRPQIEDYLRYQKWNISATTGRIFAKF